MPRTKSKVIPGEEMVTVHIRMLKSDIDELHRRASIARMTPAAYQRLVIGDHVDSGEVLVLRSKPLTARRRA